MSLVLDVSVMARWYFPDERNVSADSVLARLESQDTAVVPSLWWFEMRNVLMIGERRRRTTAQQTAEFLDLLRGLPIEVALLPDDLAVIGLARRHGLSFYDAAYLELAQREGCTLATFDLALADAARAEGVPLA